MLHYNEIKLMTFQFVHTQRVNTAMCANNLANSSARDTVRLVIVPHSPGKGVAVVRREMLHQRREQNT